MPRTIDLEIEAPSPQLPWGLPENLHIKDLALASVSLPAPHPEGFCEYLKLSTRPGVSSDGIVRGAYPAMLDIEEFRNVVDDALEMGFKSVVLRIKGMQV